MKEALFYEKNSNKNVHCFLCPHNCIIQNGNIGICKVRKNIDGKLYSLNYGKVTSYNMDPIEKKPLYHFYPGKDVFSIGSFGCNLKCSFCQNYSIAHFESEYIELSIDRIISVAKNQPNNIGIAYTYNEPSIWYEYVLDTSMRVKENNLKNVLITNGYISKEPLQKLLPFIDAMNIDLKSFYNSFYKNICLGNVEYVLKTIEISNEKCLVEISTLLIENFNTEESEIEKLAKWIASINKNIPLHLNRYFPSYKMSNPPTDIKLIKRLKNIADRYLNYVYIGNVKNVDNNTYCPNCKELLIERNYKQSIYNIENNKCIKCNEKINIMV